MTEITLDRKTSGEELAVKVENLSKTFGSRTAFKDLTFNVAYGEIFGFLGPNGAGKTTTVRTLSTLLKPTSGKATVAGIELNESNSISIRSVISVMSETPGLYNRLTVYENLKCFCELYMLKDPKTKIEKSLFAVNLWDRKDDLCGSLSKGLKQRVGLARALLNDPKVLFLDEPSSGLDPIAALEVHELIKELQKQGVTIFLTTHRLEEAEKLCDRVAILNTTLKLIGKTEDMQAQMFSKTVQLKTLHPLKDEGLIFKEIQGILEWTKEQDLYTLQVSDPNEVIPNLVKKLVSANEDLISIGEVHHSLQDIYLETVKESGE